MKLKELHIRNIASIERADIDFEKDLNDAITGDPASIFLQPILQPTWVEMHSVAP